MSRKAKWAIITAFLVVLSGLSLLVLWGTGSMRRARKWKDILTTCNSLDDVREKFNCGKYVGTGGGGYNLVRDPNTYKEGNTWALLYDFPNGDWLAMAYYPSNHAPRRRDGGTVVTRDNAGRIRAFFGHVCGRPHAFGETLEEVYACFDSRQWKEVSLTK